MPAAAVAAPRIRARVRVRSGTFAPATAFIGTIAVVIVAPFERLEPVVRLPWQSISSVELIVGLAGAAWCASLVYDGPQSWWRTRLSWPWFALVAAMGLSTIAAPAWKMNALHMTGRVVTALGVYLMVVAAATTIDRVRRLLAFACAAGVVVALLAVLDYRGVPAVTSFLSLFRPAISVVGAQVRASGPLQYPTIASMYLEIVFAWTLGLAVTASEERRRFAARLWALAAVLIAQGIVVTFTRSGLLSMAVALGMIGTAQFRRGGIRHRGVALTGVIAACVAAQILASHSLQSNRLRMTSEALDDWYRARIEAPAELALQTDGTAIVRVSATNDGLVTWDSAADPPFRLSYHWVLADQDLVVAFEGLRTEFPEPVRPGETVVLEARVRAPQRPGTYRLFWDIAEEGRLWFSTEPDAPQFISITRVKGPAVSQPMGPLRPLPKPTTRPGRLTLWKAAARIIAAYPLLGIGPDNYRLTYGAYADIGRADPRVHTNNMYLEVLVGTGLLGGCAFLALIWAGIGAFKSAGRNTQIPPALSRGLAAAGVAVLLHGFVDSFLAFTATYVLMAVALGLGVAAADPGESDAHRV